MYMQDLLYMAYPLKPIRYVEKIRHYYFPPIIQTQHGSVTPVAKWSLPSKKRRINQKQVSHTFKDVISSSQSLLPKKAEDLHHDCHRACYSIWNPTTGGFEWSIMRSCHSQLSCFHFENLNQKWTCVKLLGVSAKNKGNNAECLQFKHIPKAADAGNKLLLTFYKGMAAEKRRYSAIAGKNCA